MITVDTNILTRIITGDDPTTAIRAEALLQAQSNILIPKTVLLELEWVLRSGYGAEPRAIETAIQELLNMANVEVEDEPVLMQALDWNARGMDFADALHLASGGPNRKFVTFDKTLRRLAQRLGIVNVTAI